MSEEDTEDSEVEKRNQAILDKLESLDKPDAYCIELQDGDYVVIPFDKSILEDLQLTI